MEAAGQSDEHRISLDFLKTPAFDETAQENRRIFADALERMAGGDGEAFWSIFDPAVEFHESSCLPYGGVYKGLDEARRGYMLMCSAYSNMASHQEALLASNDLVILYQTVTFTVAANGRQGTFTAAELFRFRNSRIVEWRAFYSDPCLVARALAGED